ncbi:hypothetical protein BJ944DRAFT_237445 [Cunninghamella echinulata]|nr:hypothetical protein BJ944DRAFT_237445 [Cunninghamella echinulata]
MSNSNTLKTPQTSINSPTNGYIKTPCTGFNNLTLNSTSNGRIRKNVSNEKPSNFTYKLENALREESESPRHPNLHMVIGGGNKISIDHLMSNDVKMALLSGSDEEDNDHSEDDGFSNNSYSPGRMSVSPDHKPNEKDFYYDDEYLSVDYDLMTTHQKKYNYNKTVLLHDPFMSSAIKEKESSTSTATASTIKPNNDPFMSSAIYKKEKPSTSTSSSSTTAKSNNDPFMSSPINSKKTYKSETSIIDTSSAWIDQVFIKPKLPKHRSKKGKERAEELLEDPTQHGHVLKENKAPTFWLEKYGGSPKFEKIAKKTPENNYTTHYQGPLHEITVEHKSQSLQTSTSSSSISSSQSSSQSSPTSVSSTVSSSDNDSHVRKKMILNVSPNRMRFMRSLSPVRDDLGKRKGKEPWRPDNNDH